MGISIDVADMTIYSGWLFGAYLVGYGSGLIFYAFKRLADTLG
jgi:hypothetical protein